MGRDLLVRPQESSLPHLGPRFPVPQRTLPASSLPAPSSLPSALHQRLVVAQLCDCLTDPLVAELEWGELDRVAMLLESNSADRDRTSKESIVAVLVDLV